MEGQIQLNVRTFAITWRKNPDLVAGGGLPPCRPPPLCLLVWPGFQKSLQVLVSFFGQQAGLLTHQIVHVMP